MDRSLKRKNQYEVLQEEYEAEEGQEHKRSRPAHPTLRQQGRTFAELARGVAQEGGQIFVVGQGDCGQLGRGEDYLEAKIATHSPITAQHLKVLHVAAGGVHSVCLVEGGSVFTCGVNDEGALGRKTDNKMWEQPPAGTNADGEAGEEYTWGPVPVPSDHGKAIAVCAGDSSSAVLTDQGALYSWGVYRDSGGRYGFSPSQSIALLPTLSWTPSVPQQRMVKLASGTDHMLALTASGAVMSWGTGWQGQLGRVPKRMYDSFTAAKTAFRRAQGDFEAAEAELNDVMSQSVPSEKDKQRAQQQHASRRQAYLKAKDEFDPQEQEFRSTQLHPAPVTGIPKATGVFCGWYNSFAVDEQGRVWSFGLDNYGQSSGRAPPPGTGNDEASRFIYEPRAMTSVKEPVKAVGAGNQHTLLLLRSGRVLSFGRTTYGRLGRCNVEVGENVAREQPEPVDGLVGVDVASVAAGEEVSACVSTSGRVFTWGSGTNLQLGNAGKNSGSRNVGIDDWGPEYRASVLAAKQAGDEVLDEIVPWRLHSARLQGHQAVQVEFGGQHTLILARPQAANGWPLQ